MNILSFKNIEQLFNFAWVYANDLPEQFEIRGKTGWCEVWKRVEKVELKRKDKRDRWGMIYQYGFEAIKIQYAIEDDKVTLIEFEVIQYSFMRGNVTLWDMNKDIKEGWKPNVDVANLMYNNLKSL